MSQAEGVLVSQLSSPDHFAVCAALKQLARFDSPSDEAMRGIMECARSTTLAVERTALATLQTLGLCAHAQMLPLVTHLARRLKDAGCSYECCGYGAFHGPIEHYVEALRSLSGSTTEVAFRTTIEPAEISHEDKDFIGFLFGNG